jgi:O-antigen/teichoic acid export membrane protein
MTESHAASAVRVVRAAMTGFPIYVGAAALAYASQLVVARVVGAHTYGIYAYVIAWAGVLAYAAALGFDVALMRFVPAYGARGEWPLAAGVIKYAHRRVAAVGVALALGGAAIVTGFADLEPEVRNTFLIGFFLVPVWALIWLRCAVVRAFGGVVCALAPDRLLREALLIGIVLLAVRVFAWKIDAPFLAAATLASSAVALAVACIAARILQPSALAGVRAVYAAADWRGVVAPLLAVGAASALINRTGVLVLGWMGYTNDAGVYALAFNIAFVAALPTTAVNTLFAPAISDLFERKQQAMLQDLVGKAGLWSLGGAACVALPLAVFAEPVFAWFGQEFVGGAAPLRILLIGQIFAAGRISQLHVMTMTGHERAAAALVVTCALFNAVASVFLVGLFGPVGAALATMLTLVVWNAAMATFIWQRLGLRPGLLGLVRQAVVLP